jgi:hypothetical protein
LQLNEGVAGQGGDADGSADMAAGIAENFYKQVGRTVDCFWRIGEACDGIHLAVDGHDAFDGVERTEVLLQDGELRESAESRGGVAFFNGSVETDGASYQARGIRGDYA